MEYINTIRLYVCSCIGAISSIIIKALGGWSEDMATLMIFMIVDYAMGLCIAAVWKKSNKSENGALSSKSAWKGLIRKCATFVCVLIGYRLDLTLGIDYVKTAVILAFISSEAISIIENMKIMGLELPEQLDKAIDLLTKKEEK